MREIRVDKIIEGVKNLCIEANCNLGEDVIAALERGREEEESPLGKGILDQILENAKIAKEEGIPICQDTGTAVVFIGLGKEVRRVGSNLKEAINEGVRRGYGEGYLRKSICHPFTRKNTGDNTPAIIHLDMVRGDRLKIIVAPKGGGSENMSQAAILPPSEGVEGIKRFVIDRVERASANPCPPIIVGVGIGANFERVAILAKRALLQDIGSKNPSPELETLEDELLKEINNLGIGPQGLGGRITALAVHVEMEPCHIASLPVAVNINCHVSRHKEIVI